ANLVVADPQKLIPLEGIYAVRASVTGQATRTGVMHIGPRPTIPGANPSLEVHLFDFEGDLYAQNVTVEFHERIRGIEKFPSMEELAAAMHGDAAAARRFFHRESGEAGETG
ncbi:MAG TPA: riboflavin kinase, partial [Longimicrobiales bacterium]